MKVLQESSSMFNLQKLVLSDQEYPASNNGKFASVNILNNTYCICQIFLSRILHLSFSKIETSVFGYHESTGSNLYPVNKTVSSLSLSNITIMPRVDIIKSISISLVFSSPVISNKWKSEITKLSDLVKNILKLFVIKAGSVVSLDAIKTLFNVDIEYILIESIGNVNVGRVASSTKVKVNKLMSKITFEQLFTTSEDLPILGGLELPLKTLTELVNRVEIRKGNTNLPLYKQVLILGPPGCGKTSLVCRIARDRGLVVKSVTGPELATPLPGEAERALTAIFDECKLLAHECPGGCLLLIEHVETICGRREGSAEGHVVRLADRLCSLLETVNTTPGLMVVGTTSRPQAVDPAVRRPGRFDNEIHIEVCSECERASILRAVTRQSGLSESVCNLVAKWTPGFVGADLALLTSNVARHLDRMGLPQNYDEEEGLLSHWRSCVGRQQPSALRGQLGVMPSAGGGASFSQLGGVGELRLRLQQAIEWPLTHSEAFHRMGLPQPKGVLLYGPPGCAKTSLARAIAAATNTTFLAVSAAQIYSPYVGDAERTISELFHRARIGAPAILFIDEIDALVGCRGHREKGSQERILTSFLTEMDGVGVRLDSSASQAGVVVVAATNRPDVLDPALTRPGRFDRLIYVGPPDTSQRLDILRILTKKMPMATDVDLSWMAEHTELYSGADLARLCKEAGLCALTRDGMSVAEVSHRHWTSALQDMQPSLSKDQILKYQQMSAFGD